MRELGLPVKVIDTGWVYNEYRDFLLNYRPELTSRLDGSIPNKNKVYKVIFKGKHLDYKNKTIYCIREIGINSKRIYLVDEKGLCIGGH